MEEQDEQEEGNDDVGRGRGLFRFPQLAARITRFASFTIELLHNYGIPCSRPRGARAVIFGKVRMPISE